MQEAEIPCSPEAFRQDMLEQQRQELGTGQRAVSEAFAFALAVAKGHLPVVAGDDIFFLDHAAIQIAPEIDQCLLAGADALAVDDPGRGVAWGQCQAFLSDSLEHFGTKVAMGSDTICQKRQQTAMCGAGVAMCGGGLGSCGNALALPPNVSVVSMKKVKPVAAGEPWLKYKREDCGSMVRGKHAARLKASSDVVAQAVIVDMP
jgi:hypothetical protein